MNPGLNADNLIASLPGVPRLRITELSNAKLMRALFDGAHTLEELQEASGLGEVTVRKYVAALRREKLVRLIDKAADSSGRRTVPVFQWDPDKPDVKVKALTREQINERYAERRRAQRLTERLAQVRFPVGAKA